MPTLLLITDEIHKIKVRLRELQNQHLEGMRGRRQEIIDELARVEKQITAIIGAPVSPATTKGIAPRKRAPKLRKLVKDSDEYRQIERNIQTILSKTTAGLNGKQIADALGFVQMNERNRLKPLLDDTRLLKKPGNAFAPSFSCGSIKNLIFDAEMAPWLIADTKSP